MAISDIMAEHSAELKKARLTLAEVNQLKVDLVAAKQARESIYVATTQAQDKAAIAEVALA